MKRPDPNDPKYDHTDQILGRFDWRKYALDLSAYIDWVEGVDLEDDVSDAYYRRNS